MTKTLPDLPEDFEVDTEKYGTVVNIAPTVDTEWQDKIEELTLPIKFIVNLTAEQKNRLNRIAKEKEMTIEELASSYVTGALDDSVGKSTISQPSWAKKKVTGYKGGIVQRTNG
jgi:hypothetical protein